MSVSVQRILIAIFGWIVAIAYVVLICFSINLVQTYKNVNVLDRCTLSNGEHLSAYSIGFGMAFTFSVEIILTILTCVEYLYIKTCSYVFMYSLVEIILCILLLARNTIFNNCFRENFAYDTIIISIVVVVNSLLPIVIMLITIGFVNTAKQSVADIPVNHLIVSASNPINKVSTQADTTQHV